MSTNVHLWLNFCCHLGANCMPGLDRQILDSINPTNVIDRVKLDIRSDFILAPHYNAIFLSAGNELWSRLSASLRAGSYNPGLPLTVSVPKEKWFTRPGSILQPFDRFMYQSLIDQVNTKLEDNMDRERVFSHVPAADQAQMFVSSHECWENFQSKIGQICAQGTHIVNHHRLKAVASGYGSKPDRSAIRRTHVTWKSSSGSGGTWFLIYSAQASSVTLPLDTTQ